MDLADALVKLLLTAGVTREGSRGGCRLRLRFRQATRMLAN